MTWQTTTIPSTDLAQALDRLRGAGAIVTRCCPVTGGFQLTYCARGRTEVRGEPQQRG